MNKIVVIGSSNTDMVIKSDRLPTPGETVIGGTFIMNQGGKGANQAVAVARMGGNVTFITKTGNDLFGRQSVEGYKKENIRTNYVFTDVKNPSGVALISVDSSGENSILVAPGANSTLNIKDIDRAKVAIESADVLLMQLETPIETVEYAAKIAFEKGVKVILNPAPAQLLSNSLIQRLYMIIPNLNEAEILSGIKVTGLESAKAAAAGISKKGVSIVVITLGSDGALIKEDDQFHLVSAEKVKAIDTTAAGDTFCGTLCVGLSEGKSIVDSVKLACKAAAIAVTRMGAQSSIPRREELRAKN